MAETSNPKTTSTATPESTNDPQSLEMLPGQTVEIDLEATETLPAIALTKKDGEIVEYTPLAVVSGDESKAALFYKPSGGILVGELFTDSEGVTTVGKQEVVDSWAYGSEFTFGDSNQNNIKMARVSGYKSAKGKGDVLLIESIGKEPVEIEVDSKAVVSEKGFNELRDNYKRMREKKQKRFDRWDTVRYLGGMLMAARSIILPGGAIDDVADRFHNASGIMDEKKWEDPQPSDEIDGILLGESPRLMKAEQAAVDAHNAAVERMQDVINAMDSHHYDRLHEQAAEFRQRFADEIYSPEEIDRIRNDISESETPDETMAILRDYLAYYELNLDFYREDSVTSEVEEMFRPLDEDSVNNGDLQRTAQNIITAYSHLPRTILSEADLDTIYLTDTPPNPLGAIIGVGAAYSGGDLYIKVNNRIDDTFVAGHNAVIPDRIEHASQLHGILHETGHGAGNVLPHAEDRDVRADPDFSPSYFLTALLGHPNRATFYGSMGSEEENNADTFANALNTSFINHPDFVRFFSSEASNDELNLILKIEEQFPGFMANLYEAKLPADHHDRNQARDIILATVLLGYKPKRQPNRIQEQLVANRKTT